MALVWNSTRFPRNQQLGPYAHWWTEKEKDFIPEDALTEGKTRLIIRPRARPTEKARVAKPDAFFAKGTIVPLPKEAENPDGSGDWNIDDTKQHLPEVPDDTVLVGIVDTGVSLSNSRFRLRDGTTRFVASWQQSAPFKGQGDLPFGQEVYAGDIQKALDDHGTPKQLGYVDEVDFNRDLFLTEPKKSGGQRDLEMAAAHGTHVLDLAAGLDPDGDFSTTADRLRLLSVNLPAQYAHGTAGNFLAYFAINAVERLIHLADALWARNHRNGAKGGYPLIINFSYGMTAGPKDGNHIFEKAIRELLKARKASLGGKAPVRVIMPAGNDNLERCAASAVLGKAGASHAPTGYTAQSSINLPWRILPADSTANFVEIWFEARAEGDLEELASHLKVWVTPPGYDPLPLEPLQIGGYQDLGNFARVYVNAKGTKRKKRLALLVCVAPTILDVPGAPIGPAGLWNLKLEHTGVPVDATFFVQSDQSAVRTSKTAGRSYFDHKAYRVHLDDGGLADTYSDQPDHNGETDNDSWRNFGPVQRRGTHNALATINEKGSSGDFVVIGGFDDSSGYPSIYSSSVDGDPNDEEKRDSISVSYPSENGASQYGLLAAGARDGSVTAYRGTSMATALATRDAAMAFLNKKGSGRRIGKENWFRKRADAFEAKAKAGDLVDHWGQYLDWPKIRYLKSGVGRVDAFGGDRKWNRLGGTE